MELFKIAIGSRKKRFYESKQTFEQNWKYYLQYDAKYEDVCAFTLDWKEREWKCIRRVGPKINWYAE